MKKLFLYFILFLGLLSCKKDDPPLEIDNYADFFPLNTGNYWEFELAGKDSISKVLNINGVEYFEKINSYGTSTFYRKQGNKIYVRNLTKDNAEEMIFNLAARENETWKYGKGYVTMVNRNATITIGDNQVGSCLYFNFHNSSLVDYGHSVWLAPNIGFIQIMCQECFGAGFQTIKLKKAKINNREFVLINN